MYPQVRQFAAFCRPTPRVRFAPLAQIGSHPDARSLRYANQSARIHGLDLSGQMPLADTSWDSFGLRALVNYTRAENRDTGDGLYNIQPLEARLTLDHGYGPWSNALELEVVTDKDEVSDVRNKIKTPAYGLVHLRGTYRWRDLWVDLGAENLLDENYDLPTGGAYLGQGSTMSLSGVPWGIAVPGMGRSLYAGISYNF